MKEAILEVLNASKVLVFDRSKENLTVKEPNCSSVLFVYKIVTYSMSNCFFVFPFPSHPGQQMERVWWRNTMFS